MIDSDLQAPLPIPPSTPESATPVAVPTVSMAEWVLHWFMLMGGCAVLIMSLLMRSEGPQSVYLPGASSPLPNICSSRMIFGIDCPGCGMTRAFIAISHGQFQKAWNFNPASFLVYLLIIGQIPWQSIQLWRIRRGLLPIDTLWIYSLPLVTALALVTQWFIKIVNGGVG